VCPVPYTLHTVAVWYWIVTPHNKHSYNEYDASDVDVVLFVGQSRAFSFCMIQ